MKAGPDPTSAQHRRRRERESRKDAIFRAATRVFARDGYTGASMDTIAEVAELSKGTLYYYYASKQALFEEVAEAALQRTFGDLAERLARATTLYGVVETMYRHTVEHFLDNPRDLALLLPLIRAVFSGSGEGVSERLRQAFVAAHAPLLAPMGRLAEVERPPMSPADLRRAVATGFIGLCNHLPGPSREAVLAELDAVLALYRSALVGRPA